MHPAAAMNRMTSSVILVASPVLTGLVLEIVAPPDEPELPPVVVVVLGAVVGF